MARHVWAVQNGDRLHVVELEHRGGWGPRVLYVDGEPVREEAAWSWSPYVGTFRLGDRACAVLGRRRRGHRYDYDLVIDGVSLRTGLHPAATARELAPAASPGGRGTELADPAPGCEAERSRRRTPRRTESGRMNGCAGCGAPNPRHRSTCYACGNSLAQPEEQVPLASTEHPLHGIPPSVLPELFDAGDRRPLDLARASEQWFVPVALAGLAALLLLRLFG